MDLKKYKNTILFGSDGGFTALIYWIINKGKELERSKSLVFLNRVSPTDFVESMQEKF
jgi:hypothetical protein